MIEDFAEIPLDGGRVTRGVVRIGDTVRRPATANSDFVKRLLQHLAARGFDAAPAYLGKDDGGRDILGFIDGDVPANLAWHDDEALRCAARLIRRFHDLGAELVAVPAAASGGEVICHNDPSPCNFVFRDGAPVAIIDFDAAATGTRARDLGYAAWLWLDLGSPDLGASEQSRRLALFLAAYGTSEIEPVLAAALERQQELAAEGERAGKAAMAKWASDCMAWTRGGLAILRGG